MPDFVLDFPEQIEQVPYSWPRWTPAMDPICSLFFFVNLRSIWLSNVQLTDSFADRIC
jgi:hypothetical protein